MRLIDADALLQEFETENTKSDSNLWHITGIKAFIDNQETAYDVDKVVEQVKVEIESDKINYEFYRQKENKDMQNAYAGKITAFKNAINIIRAGGKE